MINPIIRLGAGGDYAVTFLFQCWNEADIRKAQGFFALFPWVSLIGVPNQHRLDVQHDGLSSQIPADVLSNIDSTFCVELERLLSTREFDLVQVEHSQMAWVVPIIRSLAPDTPIVLSLHNAEYRVFERWAQYVVADQSPIHDNFRKLKNWEKMVWPWFDACLSVAPEETEIYRAETKGLVPVFEVATGGGVELEKYPWGPDRSRGNLLVYLGTMEWYPNAHGLAWFLDKVLPIVREQVPDARLLVGGFGRVASELVHRVQGRADVRMLGEVDDERHLLQYGRAFVVPLWIAAGARVKIVTAWAAGIPVVATTVGAEGLAHSVGEDILIADDPHEFATHVVSVLTDAALRDSLRRNGRRLVEHRYSLDHTTSILDRAYRSLAQKHFPEATTGDARLELQRYRLPSSGTSSGVSHANATRTNAWDEKHWYFSALASMKHDLRPGPGGSDGACSDCTELRHLHSLLGSRDAEVHAIVNSIPFRAWLRLRSLVPSAIRKRLGTRR